LGENDSDAELLEKAFGIKTGADPGKNQYFISARALVELHACGRSGLGQRTVGPGGLTYPAEICRRNAARVAV